jgi:nicotinamide-nucleotide amidase
VPDRITVQEADLPQGTVEIVTIGDELLLGHTIDTNAAFLSRELGQLGFRVIRRCTVPDAEAEIANAVHAALERAQVVICTGGLGPTQDDVTRAAVASLFGVQLDVNAELLAQLEARYRLRGIPMPARNVTQAQVPRGALVLPNPRGTAPGLVLVRGDQRHCVLLPGVPHELRGLTREQLIPYLVGLAEKTAQAAHPIRYRVLRTTGIAESAVAEKVDHLLTKLLPLTVAFLPGFAGTDLRLTCWGDLPELEADRSLDSAANQVRQVLSDHIYGEGDDELAAVVGGLLRARGQRVTIAESCTGGLLGKLLSDAPGASDYFEGGVIAYSNSLKHSQLGVATATLQQHGAVSEAAVREMAQGARLLAGSAAAIAITGIAGPTGATPDKPLGTVWIAACLNEQTQTRRIVFPGDREEIRERAAQAGLALLWRLLRLRADAAPTTETRIPR